MIKHRKTRGELSRAGTRPRNDDDRLLGRDVIVASVTGIAHDCIKIVGITLNRIMIKYRHARILESLRESARRGVTVEARYRDSAHGNTELAHRVYELKGLFLVRRTVIGAALLLLDITGVDAKHKFGLIA